VVVAVDGADVGADGKPVGPDVEDGVVLDDGADVGVPLLVLEHAASVTAASTAREEAAARRMKRIYDLPA